MKNYALRNPRIDGHDHRNHAVYLRSDVEVFLRQLAVAGCVRNHDSRRRAHCQDCLIAVPDLPLKKRRLQRLNARAHANVALPNFLAPC